MYQQTQAYIEQLTALLKQHQLWQHTPIAASALQSQLPFCHDTMAFEQWLQFVFIAKFNEMIVEQRPLPRNFAVAPMAEMTLSAKPGGKQVIALLSQLDSLLGEVND